MNFWKRVLDLLLLPEPSSELLLQYSGAKVGKCWWHSLLSPRSTYCAVTCFKVLGKVCTLCAVFSVCSVTFKTSCDTSLELWGRVCWRYHGSLSGRYHRSLKSWTGPWNVGQLDVTDFLAGRGEEMEKWKQKQCCSHLNCRIHRLVDYRPIQPPGPLLVLLQQQCTPSISSSREVSPLCSFIWSLMDALQMPVLVGTRGMPCAFQPSWSCKMPRVWCCVCTSAVTVCVSGGMEVTSLPLEQ